MKSFAIDNEFIQNTAQSIITLIVPNENSEFYHGVVEYEQKEGEFPTYIDDFITEKLMILSKTNKQINKILHDYQMILNQKKYYQLYNSIFYNNNADGFVDIGGDDDDNLNDDDEIIDNSNNDNNNDDDIKEKEKPKQPVMTLKDLGLIQDGVISQISDIFSIHIEIAEILLKLFDFKKDELIDSFFSDPEANLAKIGLKSEQSHNSIHFKKRKFNGKRDSNETCPICYNDEDNGAILYSLPCGHLICKDCIKEHLMFQISRGKSSIKCPEYECKCQVILSDVIKFCGEEIATNYFNFILEQQIVSQGEYVHCLRPGCPNVLTKESIGLCNTATCSCGFRMCWKCRNEAHAPLKCELVEKWRKMSNEKPNEDWIATHTKPCPYCHEPIEKNGGCNHMFCTACNRPFNWDYDGRDVEDDFDYGEDNYNEYDQQTYDDYEPQIENPENLRFSQYFSKFYYHKQIQEKEQNGREKIKLQLIHNFENYRIKSEKLNIEDALELANEIFFTIDEARSVLIWSYPHAFFMEPNSKKLALFEYVVNDVEKILSMIASMVEDRNYESPTYFKKMMKQLSLNTESLKKHVDLSTSSIIDLDE